MGHSSTNRMGEEEDLEIRPFILANPSIIHAPVRPFIFLRQSLQDSSTLPRMISSSESHEDRKRTQSIQKNLPLPFPSKPHLDKPANT